MNVFPRYAFSYMFAIFLGSILITVNPINAAAATRTFDCDRFSNPARLAKRLNAVIGRLDRGDILQISGICTVNLTIQEEINDITLDGQGNASFIGPDSSMDVIRIEGRGIIIKGLDISGGRDGIHVHWGGVSQQRGEYGIENNVIHDVGRDGIAVHANSSTRILNNTIRNAKWGINVFENSSIRIGNRQLNDFPEGPNTIEKNSRGGIQVERSSAAHIVGATIQSNSGPGVLVRRGSQARAVNNAIANNNSDGVTVSNSTMHIGANDISQNAGNGVTVRKNGQATLRLNVTTTDNGGYAVNCETGGVVDGQVAGLNGTSGKVNLGTGCVEGLSDFP